MRGTVATLAVSLAVVAAAPAQAGTFHGAIAPTAGSVLTCVPNTVVVQFTGGSHVISSAGIVTKWFTHGGTAGTPYPMRLVIARGSDPTYTVVGRSNLESIAAGQNDFVTRIPVQAGDRVAVNGGSCMFTDTTTNPSVHYCTSCDPAPGGMFTADQLNLDSQVNARVFVEPDADADGAGDESQDNCEGLANASQANTDGDGAGDDCDIDDDQDSVPDTEDAFPLDPLESRDSDADGLGNNADSDDDNDGVSDTDEARAGSDPTNAGSRPPAAPASVLMPNLSFPPAEGTLKAPVLIAPGSVRLAALRRGIAVSADTSTVAQLDFELRGTPKGVRLARYELRLAARSLPAGSGRRSVRLKPNRRRLGSARRFTLQLRVTATDLGGNRAVATRTIKVR